MKKILISILVIVVILGTSLIALPYIDIKKNNKIIKISYDEDVSKYEDYSCYDESYFYNKKRNISISNYNIKKMLFFYIIEIEYKDGNVCEKEFKLEERYIKHFINNADIKHNDNNINVKELIKDKKAIVANKKYYGNDYENSIEYVLDGKHQILYVFYVDDLLIIQVGLSDEGPKFIAYK